MYARVVRTPSLVPFIVFVLGCGSATEPSTGAGAPASGCTPALDTTFTPGMRFDDVATESVVPWPVAGVTFTAAVTRVGDAAHIEGVLTNTTDAEVNVDYLTGGVMGLSTNPFQVEVDGEAHGATGPEISPSPRRAVMPPHGTMTFRMDRCPPSFPAHVRWTFSPFDGPAVQGEATLP